MPLGEIKRNIEAESKKGAKELKDSYSAQREKITADSDAKISEIRERLAREIKEETKRLEEENSASIEIATKNIMLAAREEALSDELERVKSDLIKSIRQSKGYERIFRNALKSAEGLHLREQLIATVSKSDEKMLAKSGIRAEPGKVKGGVLIHTPDNRVTIDATLERMMDSRIEEIRSALLEELFGKMESKFIGGGRGPQSKVKHKRGKVKPTKRRVKAVKHKKRRK